MFTRPPTASEGCATGELLGQKSTKATGNRAGAEEVGSFPVPSASNWWCHLAHFSGREPRSGKASRLSRHSAPKGKERSEGSSRPTRTRRNRWEKREILLGLGDGRIQAPLALGTQATQCRWSKRRGSVFGLGEGLPTSPATFATTWLTINLLPCSLGSSTDLLEKQSYRTQVLRIDEFPMNNGVPV